MRGEARPAARILFAEDEEGFRCAMSQLLRREGYECVDVGALAPALEAARQGPFDVLITDIRMPGNEGLRIGREVRALSPEIAIIVVTGYPSLETAVEGIHLSVDAYLSKPVSFEQLKETIEQVLAERFGREQKARRLRELEQGFRGLASQLASLGKLTGLLAAGSEIRDVPELSRLSRREWEVLNAMLLGYRAGDIGHKLAISPNTVRNHIRSILRKLEVRSQSELTLKLRPI